uniref:winged helix-turn-helix domain-containing protein n=1 Tax=Nocardioides jensenii TaxID=1843 RepID=UPI000836BE20|nr:helix-turn-helix domain-containing protein [Nocardioides jensenii]
MTSIETLRAVYHPTRRRIIDYLGIHEASQVTELAAALDEQVGSISHHLRMLERVGMVERAPELATDGRTSWWRASADSSFSWSVEEFDDRPADRMQAKAAEKLNIDHQFGKLVAWKRRADRAATEWRTAAFSSSTTTQATAAELDHLQELLNATTRDWIAAIDGDDGQQREPVFVFTHGFPSQP